MPPSAQHGTPCLRAYLHTWYTAVACGRPTAITSCVVQIEPEPMPMRSASTPHLMRLRACETHTTLPPTTCTSKLDLMYLTMSSWYVELPATRNGEVKRDRLSATGAW
eukprot:scaffold7960_cov129-Isochrysis_galbana.AAC.4